MVCESIARDLFNVVAGLADLYLTSPPKYLNQRGSLIDIVPIHLSLCPRHGVLAEKNAVHVHHTGVHLSLRAAVNVVQE